MSKVNTSNPVKAHRRHGPDYRVNQAHVEKSMRDKSVLQVIEHEKYGNRFFRRFTNLNSSQSCSTQ